MFDPSPIHIVLLLLILMLVFGSRRLPEMGRSLGRGIREFKGSVTGHEDVAGAGDGTTTTTTMSDAEPPEPRRGPTVG